MFRIAREHELWILAFAKTPEEKRGVVRLEEFCEGVNTVEIKERRALWHPYELIRYLMAGRPPDLRFYFNEDLAGKIRRITSQVAFDIVQIEHGIMGLYLEAVPQEMRNRSIWLLHDVDFEKFYRMYRLETKLSRKLRVLLHGYMMRRWEPRYAENFERCITVSEADRLLLTKANPRLRVEVSPNGVDTRACTPLPEENDSQALVFVGNMDYRPNIDAMVHFCQEVLPLIRRVVPEVEMWIVGLNPRHDVRKLDGNGVHVTGRVENVQSFYGRSAACVVPLRAGGGTRLKILEAMAFGRPVVSTSIGCEGLKVTDGENILIADSEEEFAKKTVSLLRELDLRRKIVERARELVVNHYDWDIIARKMMKIYLEVGK
jgi:glycosyltransferase involved in cell wall biosynthesis